MIRWCVKHRDIVLLICGFIFLGGLLIYPQMEREENPDVVSPMATVKCIYPGANPEDIEKLVVKPLEDQIKEITEIKTLESYAMDSVGFLKVKLKDLSDERIQEVWQKLQDKVDDAEPDLPGEALKPEVNTEYAESYGLMAGLSGDRYGYSILKKLAKKLKDRLQDDPEIKVVDLDGTVDDEIDILLDMTKLEQYQLAPTTIVKLLKARNVSIPGGNLEVGRLKIPIQTSGEYQNIDQIRDTVVGVSASGNPICLRDVAAIIRTEAKSDIVARLNKRKAVMIGVKYVDGTNVLRVRRRLTKIFNEFKKNELYEGMQLTVVTDQAKYIQESMSLFENNLLSAILLVVAVILLTMGWRSAIVVSTTIPVVIMSVFIYMQLFGIELHQVSIGSLIISLSLLVANGIVANDSIYLYLQKGSDRETACVRGVNEVQIAILTSTLTSIASFLPLAMMEGVAGKFVKSLPVLVSVALTSSYLFALTMVPATAFSILKVNEPKKQNALLIRIQRFLKMDRTVGRLKTMYQALLTKCLKRPQLVMLTGLLALAVSLAVVPSLELQLFPKVERDQYIVDIDLRDGSTATATEQLTQKVAAILLHDPSVQLVMAKVGEGPLKFYTTFIPNSISSNKAQLIVNGDRRAISRLQATLDRRIADARITVRQLELGLIVDFPVMLRISGENVTTLQRIAADLKKRIDDVPGVKNLQDNYGLDSYKLKINVNEAKANLVGLTNYDIAATTRMAINGLEITKLKQKNIDEDDLPVVIKIPEGEKHQKEIVDHLFFTSQLTGANIPISQVATVKNEFALNRIVRRDLKRTITVGMYLQDGYKSNGLQKRLEKVLKHYRLPQGYQLEFGGDSEERSSAFLSMVVPAILAVGIIYLILVFQFGNLLDPLIIMGTIPLSFIGVIWGLKLTGYPIGFMALLGSVSLMGVVVNNGIVLLDYIKILYGEGAELLQAVVEGCLTRMRPIIIGMVTTVISLIPLGLSGGSLWAPLAYSIIFGMLVSSVLTMIVIPVAFYGLKRKQYASQGVDSASGRAL
jgi:multidrug efflux pump subunit AcrB